MRTLGLEDVKNPASKVLEVRKGWNPGMERGLLCVHTLTCPAKWRRSGENGVVLAGWADPAHAYPSQRRAVWPSFLPLAQLSVSPNSNLLPWCEPSTLGTKGTSLLLPPTCRALPFPSRNLPL